MTRTRFAATLVALSFAAQLAAGATEAATQAGVSAAVRGNVDLTPVVDQAVRPIGSGEDVFLGDALKSHEDSGMQLMLLDETTITLGPSADLTIDEFVYDPATGLGELTASLAEGVFRFVTGKTSQGQDKAMTLKVPFGTIGIRGTIGAVKTDGDRSLIVLLGPGSQNNADERSGAIDVTAQGKTVSLIRPRFGTIIEPGKPPLEPFELSDLELALVLDPLAPPPSQPPALAPSITNAVHAAQQDVAAARETSGAIGRISERLDELTDPYDATTVAGGVGSNVTTFADLPIQGQVHFKNSTPLSDGGSYGLQVDVDFGARTIGGGTSNKVFVNNSPTAPSDPQFGIGQ